MYLFRHAQLNALALICPRILDATQYNEKFTPDSIYERIQDIAGIYSLSKDIYATMFVCRWYLGIVRCDKKFIPIMIEEGICFAFNAVNASEVYTDELVAVFLHHMLNHISIWIFLVLKFKCFSRIDSKMIHIDYHFGRIPKLQNWSMEGGYSNEFIYGAQNLEDDKFGRNEYPIRFGQAGLAAAFSIEVKRGDDIYNKNRPKKPKCESLNRGFKVALIVPGEALQMSKNFIYVSYDEDTFIAIKSKFITTSNGLRSYTPQQRRCFFNSERRLRFYRVYSQSSCEVECLTNFTKIECECVKFSMPRDKNTKICGAASIKCCQAAEKKLATEAEPFRSKCNCLPACTSIEYTLEINRVNYDSNTFSDYRNRYAA